MKYGDMPRLREGMNRKLKPEPYKDIWMDIWMYGYSDIGYNDIGMLDYRDIGIL